MPLNIRDEIVDSVSVSLLQHVALLPRIAMPHTKTLRIKTAVATAGSECVSLPVVLSDWQLVEPLAMRTDTAIYAARPVADDGQHCQYCVKLVRPDAVHCEQAVARLLHRMLSKEPLRRPQSADEVVRSLVSLEIDSFCEQHQ